MPRSSLRLHLENGFYYVVHRSNGAQPFFREDDDYALLEQTIASRLTRWRARVHAFCWLPTKTHLLLQIADAPLERVVQGISYKYARAINTKYGVSGSVFQDHYYALLIEPGPYLLLAMRHIHEVFARTHSTNIPHSLRASSHSVYSGDGTIPWLTTDVVQALLGPSEAEGCANYHRYMREPLSLEQAALFNSDKRRECRVLCSAEFFTRLPRTAKAHRATISLDQIMASVAFTLGVGLEEITSRSSARHAALARAMIAGHAISRGAATLNTVAARLDRAPSSLSEAIAHYRQRRPEMFHDGALVYPRPLLGTTQFSWKRESGSGARHSEREPPKTRAARSGYGLPRI